MCIDIHPCIHVRNCKAASNRKLILDILVVQILQLVAT